MSEESARDRLIQSVTSRLNQASSTGSDGRPPDATELAQLRAESLGDLGMLLLRRRVTSGDRSAGRAAITVLRQAVAGLAANRPSRAMTLCNLGYALLVTDPRPDEITEAVATLREAFGTTPPGDVNYARCANGLGLALLGASAITKDRGMLAEAADKLRIATRNVPDTEPNLPQMLSDLGFALTAYVKSAGHGETGDPGVAEEAVVTEEAVVALRRAADLISMEDPRRPQVLLRLADALMVASRPAEATELLVRNDAAFPAGSPQFQVAESLLVRAALLDAQLKRDRDPDQKALRDLLDTTLAPLLANIAGDPSDSSENPLAAMWNLIGGRVEATDRSRHADSMRLLKEMLATPDDVSAMPGLMAKIMETVGHRFDDLPPEERNEALADYLESARRRKDAQETTAVPVDTSGLDELWALHARLLPELEPGSREEFLVRNGQRLLTLTKITSTSVSADVGAQLRRARELAPLLKELTESLPRDLERLGIASGTIEARAAFAHAHASPFETLAMMGEWIQQVRRKLAWLPPDSPELTETKTALAVVLFHYATVSSDEASFREARDIARGLAASAWPVSAVLLSAWAQGELLRLRHATLVSPSPDEAGRSAHPLTRLASDQAVASLAERDATGALETLEDGRSHLLSNALNTRAEMEALRGTDAEHYSRLLTVLEDIAAMRRAGVLTGRLATPEEGEQFQALANEGTRLVAELKQRPGFSRFLIPSPLGLADLKPAAADGPVVTINVNRRCDALALCPDGLRTVPLPGLTARDLAEQADSFRTAVGIFVARPSGPRAASARAVFAEVLGWLWDALAEPVLEALGFSGPPVPGAPWPRIWWSPTGVLNSFPLHAAGHHDRPGASVLDRVASSYTPTLRALLLARARARRAREEREGRHEEERRRVLAVAMPDTAGHAPLTQTVAEATAAAGHGGLQLTGTAASRMAVLSALPGTAVAHFACHARSDPEDPAASHLLLSDGPLPLHEIAALRLDGAELAYLSACGTSRGGTALADEAIHLAAAFQLAGYAQSVGTLWEVGDTFAAKAAAEFHRILAPAMADPAPLPAALALHATVRELRRSRPNQPWAWTALVHAGA